MEDCGNMTLNSSLLGCVRGEILSGQSGVCVLRLKRAAVDVSTATHGITSCHDWRHRMNRAQLDFSTTASSESSDRQRKDIFWMGQEQRDQTLFV